MTTLVDSHYQEIVDISLTSPENIDHIPAQDILAVYLRQTGHVPLLAVDEEVVLSQRIRTGKYAQRVLSESNAMPEQMLSALHELIIDAQLAREALARANIRLVVSIAKQYREGPLPFVDVIQEGNIGLMLAVDRFDPTLGNRFSTYATYWIHHAIRRGITRTSRIIRLPQDVDDLLRQIHATRETLRQESGQEPGIQAISKRLNIPPRKIKRLLMLEPRVISLSASSTDEIELGELLADGHVIAPEEATHTAILKDAVEQALSSLSEREAEVIRLRYGLRDGITHTLEQIGEAFNLSKERIRQIESAALAKLRKVESAGRLYEFSLED